MGASDSLRLLLLDSSCLVGRAVVVHGVRCCGGTALRRSLQRLLLRKRPPPAEEDWEKGEWSWSG